MEELAYLAIGAVAGAVLGPRLRSVLLEAMTGGYKVVDKVSAQTAEGRKSMSEFFAEARGKARKSGRPASAKA
jgi:hypothetical protein